MVSKVKELTDRQLLAVNRNCRQAVRDCFGCLASGIDGCKKKVEAELETRGISDER